MAVPRLDRGIDPAIWCDIVFHLVQHGVDTDGRVKPGHDGET
jgi:hypothetical protein